MRRKKMKLDIKYIIETIKTNVVMLRWAALFVLFIWFLIAQIQVVPGAFASITLILGLLLLALDLAFEWRSLVTFFTGKNARKGLRLSATLFLTAAILGLLYYISVRQITIRADMTSDGRFSLSEQTLLMLNELDEPVKFWIFKMEVPHNATQQYAYGIEQYLGLVRKMEELLRDYARKNSRISFEVVDINEEPEYAREFNVTEPFIVVATAGRKNKQIAPREYIVRTQSGDVPQFEECFTSAINTLTRQTTWKIVFTSGHLERDPFDDNYGYSMLSERLGRDGFTVESTNLLTACAQTGRIPEDYDLLVLAGPRDDLHPNEVLYIEDYLMQGRPAFFMAKIESKPNYRALVSRWGADIGTGMIYDPEGMVSQNSIFGRHIVGFLPGIEPHRITRGLTEDTQRQPMLSPITVPLFRSHAAGERFDEASNTQFANYSMYSLLKSSPDAWEETDLRAPGSNNAGKRRGPFDAAFVITVPPAVKEIQDGQAVVTRAGPAKELNLAVFGDADFVANTSLSPANLDLFLATVNWAIGQEGRIAISPRAPRSYPIRLTEGEDNFMKYFAIVVMPLVVIVTGIVVYFRRKRYGAV
jgi:hypothetical protein